MISALKIFLYCILLTYPYSIANNYISFLEFFASIFFFTRVHEEYNNSIFKCQTELDPLFDLQAWNFFLLNSYHSKENTRRIVHYALSERLRETTQECNT